MGTATESMTAEEFWLLPEAEVRRSLVRGQVVEAPLLGAQQGIFVLHFAIQLHSQLPRQDAGELGISSGFILARNPDTVRGPNISFVRADRLPSDGVPEGFWDQPPDLAVEIVSPSESAQDVREKVRDYLDAGTPLVWVAYPRTREVIAHTPDGMARAFREDELLVAPAVLPGFSCLVGDLFA